MPDSFRFICIPFDVCLVGEKIDRSLYADLIYLYPVQILFVDRYWYKAY